MISSPASNTESHFKEGELIVERERDMIMSMMINNSRGLHEICYD